MGKRDSRGSIQQPMVEQEVVPIDDSSSEEVCREVSDNESFSFKRLMDLSHVDTGIFGLRAGVEPPTTPLEEQPSSVMTIMPLSPPKVIGKTDGGEVRVSPRNKHPCSDKVPSSPSFVAGFKWVRDNVL